MTLRRRIYTSFVMGARLYPDDVVRLLATRGHNVSRNRAREFGRHSDRGSPPSLDELQALIGAWADEQRPPEIR